MFPFISWHIHNTAWAGRNTLRYAVEPLRSINLDLHLSEVLGEEILSFCDVSVSHMMALRKCCGSQELPRSTADLVWKAWRAVGEELRCDSWFLCLPFVLEMVVEKAGCFHKAFGSLLAYYKSSFFLSSVPGECSSLLLPSSYLLQVGIIAQTITFLTCCCNNWSLQIDFVWHLTLVYILNTNILILMCTSSHGKGSEHSKESFLSISLSRIQSRTMDIILKETWWSRWTQCQVCKVNLRVAPHCCTWGTFA